MQFRLFTIPAYDPDAELSELNRFLASVKVFQVDRQFHSEDRVWQMMVGYQEKKGSDPARGNRKKNRIDYREVLKPDEFVLFDRLRRWRKEQAEVESIPAYAILTNEQLAGISKLSEFSLAEIARIDGVGSSRMEKYGEILLELCREKPATKDSGDL